MQRWLRVPFHIVGRIALVASVGVAALGATSFHTSTKDSAGSKALKATASFRTMACPVDCLTAVCGWTQHKAIDDSGGLDQLDGGSHDSCLDRSCAWADPSNGRHPPCGGLGGLEQPSDVDRMFLFAEAGRGEELAELIALHPETLALNTERSSIQMYGCRNRVLLNLPVGDELASRVSARLRELAAQRRG